MWIRGMFLIAFAVCIDALQAILGWVAFAIGLGLQSLTPYGGAAAGAAAAGYTCFNSTGGIVAATAAAAKCALTGAIAGALASTFGIPLGTALGFVLEIVISITLGSALIFLLIVNGMYSSTRTTIGFLVEIVPGLDIIPGWTFMTIACVLKKIKEEGKLQGKASTALATKLLPGTALGGAVSAVKYIQQQKVNAMRANGVVTEGSYKQSRINSRQRIKTELKSIDGITPGSNNAVPRAANDNNRPYVQKTA